MAKLGRELAAAAASVTVPAAGAIAPAAASKLGMALAGSGAVVFRDVTMLVGDGVPARMRLLGHDEEIAATVAFGARLAELAISDPTPLTADVIEQERARQYLSRALFDADDVTPIGTAADWSSVAITGAVLQPLWIEYADLRSSYDPAADPLPEGDIVSIAREIEKKNAAYLTGCGTTTLVRWLLSTAGRPAASPIPTSSPSPADVTT